MDYKKKKINLDLIEIRRKLISFMFPVSYSNDSNDLNDFLKINDYIDSIFGNESGETKLSEFIKGYYNELIENLNSVVETFNSEIDKIYYKEKYSEICKLINHLEIDKMLANITKKVFYGKYSQLETLYETAESGMAKRVFPIKQEYSEEIRAEIGLVNKYIYSKLNEEINKRKAIYLELKSMCRKESQAGGSKKRKRKYKKKKTKKYLKNKQKVYNK